MLKFLIILTACIGSLACSQPEQSALPGPDADLGISAQDGQAQDRQAEAFIPVTKITNLSAKALTKTPTILMVKWETSRPCKGQVRFGLSQAHGLSTPTAPAANQKHQALLKGLPASSDVFLEVTATPVDGSPPVTLKHKARTGALPAGLPALTLSKHDKNKSSEGYTLVPIMGASGSAWLAIIDSLGRYVWWDTGLGAIHSAHISLDRKAVLALQGAVSATSGGRILQIPLDGGPMTTIKAPGAHTDFVEIAAGKYALIGWEVRTFANGKRKLLGDTIMEVSKGGTPKVVWNVYDHLKPDLTKTYMKG